MLSGLDMHSDLQCTRAQHTRSRSLNRVTAITVRSGMRLDHKCLCERVQVAQWIKKTHIVILKPLSYHRCAVISLSALFLIFLAHSSKTVASTSTLQQTKREATWRYVLTTMTSARDCKYLPQQRRIPPALKMKAKSLLEVKANKLMVREQLKK